MLQLVQTMTIITGSMGIDAMENDTTYLPAKATDHLDTLRAILAAEIKRRDLETSASMRALRTVWVKQNEKEVANEIAFLKARGISFEPEMTDDELLAALDE